MEERRRRTDKLAQVAADAISGAMRANAKFRSWVSIAMVIAGLTVFIVLGVMAAHLPSVSSCVGQVSQEPR